jgi:putative flippase GtrA
MILLTLLARLASKLPPRLQPLASPERQALLAQLMMFGTVGVAGLIADTATVYALRGTAGLYAAGLAAYLSGATTTWALNRHWTFRGLGEGSALRQWARFLGANMAGFTLNRGTYFALITFAPVCARNPVLATSAGAVCGMALNFTASRKLVFR